MYYSKMRRRFALKKRVIVFVFAALLVMTSTSVSAKHGKDDPAGDDRGGQKNNVTIAKQGKDNPTGDYRHGRGKDDLAGDDRRGHR
jgi:hypothetical protein